TSGTPPATLRTSPARGTDPAPAARDSGCPAATRCPGVRLDADGDCDRVGGSRGHGLRPGKTVRPAPGHRRDLECVTSLQTRSKSAAKPCPPPMHIVSR